MGFHHTLRGDCSSAEGFQLPLRLGSGVVVAVALQQIDCAPDAKTGTECDDESLKYGYCAVEKCHIEYLLFVAPLRAMNELESRPLFADMRTYP